MTQGHTGAHLKAQARQATIGQLVDDAMAGIERDNPASAERRVRDAEKLVRACPGPSRTAPLPVGGRVAAAGRQISGRAAGQRDERWTGALRERGRARAAGGGWIEQQWEALRRKVGSGRSEAHLPDWPRSWLEATGGR